MKTKNIIFTHDGVSHNIKVELCDTPWKKFRGLMFRNSSLPLLFTFKKEKSLSIHSFFCKPFTAIWLDKGMKATKFVDAKSNKFSYSGKGCYLLEVIKNNDSRR